MLQEKKEEAELFELNLKYVVLAGNPTLFKHIWPEEGKEEVEWITPQSEEEFHKLVAELDSMVGEEIVSG